MTITVSDTGAVVVLTLTRIIKVVVTGQAPVTPLILISGHDRKWYQTVYDKKCKESHGTGAAAAAAAAAAACMSYCRTAARSRYARARLKMSRSSFFLSLFCNQDTTVV